MLAHAFLCVTAPASPSLDGHAAVRSVLQRTEGATSCKDDVLVRRLTALGPGAAPTLFRLVTGEAIEELLGESEAQAWLCPPENVGALALESLANLPEEPVRACLRAHASERPDRSVRVAALNVLGRQASSGGLALFFELLAESGDELEMRAVRAPASAALASILRADAQAARALEGRLLAAPVPEQRLACEALAASGRAESCALLTKLIGRDAELDLAVLEALAQLTERYPWRTKEETLALLRATLEHGDARVRAAGARALGRVRDAKAAPTLIARLGDADPEVVGAAQWALRESTGQTRPAAREQWDAWLEAERTWWRDEGKTHVANLAAGDTTRLSQTLRDALKHPLARQPVVDALLATIADLGPDAKVMACATLAELRALDAVPGLVELLFENDARVHAAAWNALRALTGEDLPAEPRLWEEYAFG